MITMAREMFGNNLAESKFSSSTVVNITSRQTSVKTHNSRSPSVTSITLKANPTNNTQTETEDNNNNIKSEENEDQNSKVLSDNPQEKSFTSEEISSIHQDVETIEKSSVDNVFAAPVDEKLISEPIESVEEPQVERRPSSSLSTSSRKKKRKDKSPFTVISQHSALERQSSGTSDYNNRPNKYLERQDTSNQPRVLKRRVKQERRSKSADPRSRKRLENPPPARAKDDLDRGEFTVVGRPNNPWVHLKRNKSEPNLHVRKQDETEKNNTEERQTLSRTKSTPNLNKADTRTREEKPLERKRSSHNIFIKSVQSSTTTSTDTQSIEINKHTSQSTKQITDQEQYPETQNSEQKSDSLKRKVTVEEDTHVLKNQEKVLKQALEFQKSVENILEDITQEPQQPISKSTSSITKEENKYVREESVVKRTEKTVHKSSSEKSEDISTQRTRRVIILKDLSSDLDDDLHDQSIEILKDFIRQLIYEEKIHSIVSIKKLKNQAEIEVNQTYSSSSTSENEEDEEEVSMYRKSLQGKGLGLERTSSMPEMTRDEFLEKQEEMKQNGGLKRNNSLTNINKEKKRVIKTKVSSRLLQPTAASSGKRKDRIPYVPPSKKAEQQWTDRPLKNVDSGYTTQTFVKYYDPEKPRNIEQAENYIQDDHEFYEWRDQNNPNNRGQPSPNQDRQSPYQRDQSPNRQGQPPNQYGYSPNQRGYSPNQQDNSPNHYGYSPNPDGHSPNSNYSPGHQSPNGRPGYGNQPSDNQQKPNSDHNNNTFISEVQTSQFSSSVSSEYIQTFNTNKVDRKLITSGTEDDETDDPHRMKTAFVIGQNKAEPDTQEPIETFTTFSPKQNTTFLSGKPVGSVHDSKTFKYVYTIDAELSYREYNKLMNIINLLQEQKKKWEDEVFEVRDKLEKTGKEKMQLAHNNHILRQSLEAANKAIKEINGKVQELKQTLVPLREDNTTLKEENEELKSNIEIIVKEKTELTYELQEYKKMELVFEEKLSYKDTEIQNSKKSMHEKFRKLEEAYRIYKEDMENKHRILSHEVDDLRKSNETLKREIESLKNENEDLKETIQEMEKKHEKIELDLKKQKLFDEQLQNATKETQLLSANTEELEQMYMAEIEKATGEIEQTRKEIDRYKDETRALEGENDQLKFDIENLENRLKDMENNNETKENERKFETQQKDILKSEIDELKKQLVELGSLKQEKMMLTEDKQRYKDQLDQLQQQILEYEKLKRESFINQHENQRLRAELESLKKENEGMEDKRKELAANNAENQRLKSELQSLKQQLVLLEDKQKYISSPFNDEIKHELENIRTQMKDIADKNQDRKVEVYSDELRSELESLRNQIKDLDQINRPPLQPPPPPPQQQQQGVIIRETNNTNNFSEKERILEKVIYIKDEYGNLKEAKESDIINHGNNDLNNDEIKRQKVEEVPVKKEEERQVSSAAPFVQTKPNETSVDDKKVEDQTKQTKPNASPLAFSSSLDDEKAKGKTVGDQHDGKTAEELKQQQIEDRIRRKREQQTGWQLKTPNIHKMKRGSLENMDDDENFMTNEVEEKPRGRSRSSGRRARSVDLRRKDESLDRLAKPLERAGSMRKARERGRSPHRRARGYESATEKRATSRSYQQEQVAKQQQQQHQQQQHQQNVQKHQENATKKHQHYKLEVKVDNSRATSTTSTAKTNRQEELQKILQPASNLQPQKGQPPLDNGDTSPSRRRRARSSLERIRNERYADSSDDLDERQPRKKSPTKSRDLNYDASADMLNKAMRSRQEQAMTNKIGSSSRPHPTHTDYGYQQTNGLMSKSSSAIHHHQQQRQQHHHYDNLSQQKQKQHVITTKPVTENKRPNDDITKSNPDLRYQNFHQNRSQETKHLSLNQNENSHDRRYNTMPVNPRHPPMKPKRNFTTSRGYQTDSNPIHSQSQSLQTSLSQTNLYQRRNYEETNGSSHKPPQQHHINQDQSVTLQLKATTSPTTTKQQHTNDNNLYAQVDKTTTSKNTVRTSTSRKALSEDEHMQVERMEKARQKLLHKKMRKEEDSKSTMSTSHSSSTSSGKEVITRAGVPLQRNVSENSPQNNFITEQQADAMFNRSITKASQGHQGRTRQKEEKSKPTYSTIQSVSNDFVRTSTWSEGGNQQKQQQQQGWERTNTMPRNQVKSSDRLTRENVQKHQSRSYRDTKIHDGAIQGRHKSNAKDPNHRLSAMSFDSLGGFSQITYTTVDESKHGARYEDYATQIDDDIERSRRKGDYHDDSDILRHAKHIPKGHSKSHCERCRELNKRKQHGEPIQFCWEKYYPISETTPRTSVVSLQHMK